MKKLYSRLILKPGVVLLFIAASALSLADSDYRTLPGFIETGMGLWHVPGMAVTVVSGEAVLFQQGFGETATTNGEKVDENTLFALASTTKAMVATGILMLADEGRLSLDDPIINYLPELRFSDPLMTRQITLRDLLAHRTGLPSTDTWEFLQNMPLDEQIRRLRDVPAAAPPRTRLIYQNTMYELVGLVIQRISGEQWDVFLKKRLWRPLKMNDTVSTRAQIGNSRSHVLPYFYQDGALLQAEWETPANQPFASGSVWSSIHDMGLWAQFLLRGGVTADGERLVSEAGIAEMFSPQQLSSAEDFYPTVELTRPNWRSYGLAWFQQDFQGRKIDFHTGSLDGLIAIIGLDRAADRAVVVLGNRDHAELRHAILWEVMDNSPSAEKRDWNRDIFDLYARLSAQQEADWVSVEAGRIPDTHPSLPLDRYAGEFSNPALGQVSISITPEGIALNTANRQLPMRHWHYDIFLVDYPPLGLREFAEFRIGPDGTISGLRMLEQDLLPVVPD